MRMALIDSFGGYGFVVFIENDNHVLLVVHDIVNFRNHFVHNFKSPLVVQMLVIRS